MNRPMIVAWQACQLDDPTGEHKLLYHGARVPAWATAQQIERLLDMGAIRDCTPAEYAAAPNQIMTTSGPDDPGTISGIVGSTVEHQPDDDRQQPSAAWVQ